MRLVGRGTPRQSVPTFASPKLRAGKCLRRVPASPTIKACSTPFARCRTPWTPRFVAAREQGKSLNEVTIEALARGAGVSGEPCRRHDLHDIAGTWRNDRAFDRAPEAQDAVDEESWR